MTTRPLDSARKTLALEADGLRTLADSLNDDFNKAVALLAQIKAGRVIVSGMGKSGHIGNKITATLASTGTPAQFVHPAEAGHGDLGMITQDDVILALSWSGETAELGNLINYARRFDIALIALTSKPDSTLGRNATICLTLPEVQEACPNGLAPTTSTTLQLALGDALAVALVNMRNFSAEDFRDFHPGGKLGAALNKVAHVMHDSDRLPLAQAHTQMADALLVMTEKGLGCLGIIDDKGALIGIITDGDLRRHMAPDLLEKQVQAIMTRTPVSIASDCMAGEALAIMRARKIQCLFVCEDKKPIGLVRFLDLLDAGVA